MEKVHVHFQTWLLASTWYTEHNRDHTWANSHQDKPQVTWECHSSLSGKNKAAPGTQQTGFLQMASYSSRTLLKTCLEWQRNAFGSDKSLIPLDQAGSRAVHLRAWSNLLKELHSNVDSSEVSKECSRSCPGSGARNLRNPESNSYGIGMVPLIMGKQKSKFSILPYIALADT